ncbi:diguanylate cyclase (GGDEF) domain-containing protein [Amycolatopsis marina]|uniref:Diguanylate cyclase (GGDEF) domain-containing protein n=1 Tax=Amycolatopsis marina TaxID=490629 RepID=A0A1I1BAY0_9PSEU|nr:GGDEF domain-containing protein [Amycolatopsis marina]SFB47514.1 diguanylate cyclase (GGDEF) domain-containing protein [Amycolatopsis marina]
MSDAWLLGRARELNAIVQRSDRTEQLKIIGTVDELLEETQRRGEPILIAQLLRAASLARLVTRGIALEAEPLLDELLAHTRRHGLALLRADAHAIRGRLLVLSVQEDAALTEIARALAILDDSPTPDVQLGRRAWDRLLSSALIDCWIVLNQLGVYEAAEEVIARAHQAVRDSAGPHEITLQLINRVKMLLGWGLRLERVGRDEEAGEKFRTAASMAIAVEAPFAESLFPRQSGVPAVDQVGVLAASLALAAPSSAHIDRLSKLNAEQGWPHEHVIVTIALARCLDGDGRRDEAMRLLIDAQHLQAEDNSQPSMRLNLFREIARLGSAGAIDTTAGTAALDGTGEIDSPTDNRPAALLAAYSAALEAELWSLRESQIATLNTRREHERLSAEHGAITQQALQDPLTGLPNRRALDDRLRTLAGSVNAQPLAVALVDLDGFKDVNDRHSHAEGDDVLRVVASTLRDALRGDDLVARYGGDEFIALLPGAPVSAAKQALGRAVTAVASLPHHLSHGVTLSVGLVSLRPQERAEQVLSRADAAMYQAKRRGGNQIASATAAVGDPMGGWSEDITPTDPTWDLEEHT